jgi:Glycosyltransferase family 87
MLGSVLVALYLTAWAYEIGSGSPPLNGAGVPLVGDYIAFHTAGLLVRNGDGAHLYDNSVVQSVQTELLDGRIAHFYDGFRNPPFFALPFVALSLLPLTWAFIAWTALSLGCLGLALWLLCTELPDVRSHWPGAVLLVFAFAPVYFGLVDGENATVSLLLYVLIFRALRNGNSAHAGIWSALGLFKPQLFIVFPVVLLVRRQWRGLLAYAATGLILTSVSIAVVGPAGVAQWVRVIVEPESANSMANAWRMASVKSFFDLALPGNTTLATGLYVVTSAALLAALGWAWTTRRIVREVAWVITCLIAVLIDPHLVDYDLTVLVSAGVIALACDSAPLSRWLVAAMYVTALLRPALPIGAGAVLVTPLVIGIAFAFTLRPLFGARRSHRELAPVSTAHALGETGLR